MRIFLLCVLSCAAALAQAQPPQSPDPATANLPAGTIGPNDLIALSVYDAPEFTRTVRVGPDGFIRLPMLKRLVHAGGLLPAELEIAIADALEAEQILVSPAVTVTVAEYSSKPISVAGAVKAPLTFQAAGKVTLLEALTRAGGLAPEAGQEILLTQTTPAADGNPVTSTRRISVAALLHAADPAANIELTGGEEIRVPDAGRIFVVGNVRKPGAFPLEDNAETTVMKALALAEGLEPYASKQAYIIRRDDRAGTKTEIPIPLSKIMARKAADVTLTANDVLYIPDSSGRRKLMSALDRASLFGATTASGVIIWSGRR